MTFELLKLQDDFWPGSVFITSGDAVKVPLSRAVSTDPTVMGCDLTADSELIDDTMSVGNKFESVETVTSCCCCCGGRSGCCFGC